MDSRLRKIRIVRRDDGDSNATAVRPVQGVNVKKSTAQEFAAIFGGVGAALLVVIIIVLVCFCFKRLRRVNWRKFATESSFPSPSVEWQRSSSPNPGALSSKDVNSLLPLTSLDLEHATGNFGEGNIIGEGAFGVVYKGLLTDGSIVAIKRRVDHPIQSLRCEVNHMAIIKHKHLVKLVGFCEEKNQQFLVYDFLLNQNVGNHLYDNYGLPTGKLDMHQRVLIAIGAAKGLEHLHSFQPPILHTHFGTTNVLIDENFTAKVSDYGIFGLLVEECYALPSRAVDCFLDPQLKSYKDFSERSDVYSFGVFLLELISGRKAFAKNQSDEQQESLVSLAKGLLHVEDFVDKKLRHYSTQAMKRLLELALECVDSVRRPAMEDVVDELEKIHRKIRRFHTNDQIANVTLGSELFKGSSSDDVENSTISQQSINGSSH